MTGGGEIWDGNGGSLDPATASQRDLLVSLHYKVDYAVRTLNDHEERIREAESRISRGLGAIAVVVFVATIVAAVIGSH